MTTRFRLIQVACVWVVLIAHSPSGVNANEVVARTSGGDLRAGAAVADITPPLGELVVGGFEPFPAAVIHDKLHARCLVLDDGRTQLGFVICDSVGIPREIFDEAREEIAEQTTLLPQNVLMAATHTHSATRANTEKYRPVLVRGIVESVRLAMANLEPAKIGWSGIDEPSQVFNRRWYVSDPDLRRNPYGGVDQVRMNPVRNHPSLVKPAGPIDPEISVLSVQSSDGRPIAVLANYSLHYVGNVNKGDVSADYFGVFAERIAELLDTKSANPPFVGLLTNGTSGDINNVNFREPRSSEERYEKINLVADLVANHVKEACDNIEYNERVTLGSQHRELTLKRRKPDATTRNYIAEVLAKSDDSPTYHAQERYHGAAAQRQFEGPDEVAVPLQAFRIGNLAIAALPFEVFVEIGLELKEKTPFADTFTIELANSSEGYLPTPAQHELGGYETWLGTNRVQKDASVLIVEQVLDMFNQLAKEPAVK
ncbi:Neutral/alkaline non-lysosomal ceramidase [Rubripirellula amarantea]|uniref:Neutral/alkaline non-lysosomal ceramidase n=1 Tax=Rubripirellula amarantea TaxID=2527999 RepID=A0A5C5WQJ8_9BACT|nr:neutral/alkaline non-lysosomal ceramidase N-terminal domain-containing protein [Rubripirellula amarantea]TWT53066.1 Neutral/alkaline non-lysosomal ceramidase [Rubripirellula amarantea]